MRNATSPSIARKINQEAFNKPLAVGKWVVYRAKLKRTIMKVTSICRCPSGRIRVDLDKKRDAKTQDIFQLYTAVLPDKSDVPGYVTEGSYSTEL